VTGAGVSVVIGVGTGAGVGAIRRWSHLGRCWSWGMLSRELALVFFGETDLSNPPDGVPGITF